jgi:5-methylcytosine-specific restriction endonuclease McrA
MLDTFDFLKNKYTKWYFNVITAAQSRDISGYTEEHHIIPKSLGGNNKKENLVKLTGREHFICHWLLTKMVSDTKQKYQMWNAFSCMLYRENTGQDRYKVNSKTFECIKKAGSTIKSKMWSGEGNPMYGLRGKDHPAYGKKWTDEHRKNSSISHKGRIQTIESRQKQSASTKGRTQSIQHIQNRSGENHPGYGKELSMDRKEKIRQSVLNMPLHTCEHCGKTTTKGNYKRWHNDNCKVIKGELKFLD